MMMDLDEKIQQAYDEVEPANLEGVGVYLVGDKLMQNDSERIIILFVGSEGDDEDTTYDNDSYRESYQLIHQLVGDYEYLVAKEKLKLMVQSTRQVLLKSTALEEYRDLMKIESLTPEYDTDSVLRSFHLIVSFQADEEYDIDEHLITDIELRGDLID